MNMIKRHQPPKAPFACLLAGLLLIAACTPLIGPYSQTAYENAVNLKVETLAMMDNATEPYAEHEGEAEALKIKLDQAYEFVAGTEPDGISAKQWKILTDPKGNLVGKFFLRWEQAGDKGLTNVFVKEFKGPVAASFDAIICLEANKKEATTCTAATGE